MRGYFITTEVRWSGKSSQYWNTIVEFFLKSLVRVGRSSYQEPKGECSFEANIRWNSATATMESHLYRGAKLDVALK